MASRSRKVRLIRRGVSTVSASWSSRVGEVVTGLRFEDALQQIFAVQVIHRRYPDQIKDEMGLIQNSFVEPDTALSEASQAMRAMSKFVR